MLCARQYSQNFVSINSRSSLNSEEGQHCFPHISVLKITEAEVKYFSLGHIVIYAGIQTQKSWIQSLLFKPLYIAWLHECKHMLVTYYRSFISHMQCIWQLEKIQKGREGKRWRSRRTLLTSPHEQVKNTSTCRACRCSLSENKLETGKWLFPNQACRENFTHSQVGRE